MFDTIAQIQCRKRERNENRKCGPWSAHDCTSRDYANMQIL